MEKARRGGWIVVTAVATVGGAWFFVGDLGGALSDLWEGASDKPIPSLMLLAAFVTALWLSQDHLLRLMGLSNDRILKRNMKRWLEEEQYSISDRRQGTVGDVSFVLSADLYKHDPATGKKDQVNGFTIVKDRGSRWTKLGVRWGLDDAAKQRFEGLSDDLQRRVVAAARRSLAQTTTQYQRLQAPLVDIVIEELIFTQDGLSERELWESLARLKRATVVLAESIAYELYDEAIPQSTPRTSVGQP